MTLRVLVLGALVGGALDAGSEVAGGSGASSAASPRLAVGAPFSLRVGSDAERVALGSDGTAWVAADLDIPSGQGFSVLARTATGHWIRPVNVSHAELPSVAVAGSTAMFVWYSVAAADPGTDTLDAMRCTPNGCGQVQILARWRVINAPPQRDNVNVGYIPQPAVVAVHGRFVVLFEPLSANEAMEWVQTDGSTFGPVHSFGTAGEPYPVAATQSDGTVIAAWPGALDSALRSAGIEWARWSASGGFSTPQHLAGTQGYTAGLVAAGAAGGVALAWLQGASNYDGAPGEYTCPVWAALPSGDGGIGRATLVYPPGAGQLSLAGGGAVFALAFARVTVSGYADDAQGTYLERSVNGQPFGRPIDLDINGGPFPGVAVAGHGDAVIVWKHEPPSPNGSNTTVRLALVAANGHASTATTLGAETFDDSPLIASTPTQTLIAWQRPDATGVLTTP